MGLKVQNPLCSLSALLIYITQGRLKGESVLHAILPSLMEGIIVPSDFVVSYLSSAHNFFLCIRVFFKLFPEGVKAKFLYPFMILNMHLKG